MSERAEFTEALKGAVAEKTNWFNSEELPRMLDNYRLLHTCIKNLYDLLLKRALITADPYKLEKKISDIKAPEETAFAESDASVVIGARFSDYESMMDFVCTYFKFSVENFDLAKIKRFNELNNSFQWTNFNTNNPKVNTKGLASLLNEARRNLPAISLSMVNDSVSKSGKAITEITRILKELSDFKREEYKLNIRTQIMSSSAYNSSQATDAATEIAEIKKHFPSIMGKMPFYSELVNEITEEDFSPSKDAVQQKTLERLKVTMKVVTKEKEKVNTKQMLMETIRVLSNLSNEYANIAGKLNDNVKIIEGAKNTFFNKLKRAIRKAFNLKEPPLVYKFIIVDQQKQTKQAREIDINIFISNVARKANFLGILSNPQSPEIKKINESPEEQILQFVNKQISENNETLTLLTAADEYFKTNAAAQDRPKIKGLKIDLVSVKNIIVKANQKRAEYVSYAEELIQMQKLGISES